MSLAPCPVEHSSFARSDGVLKPLSHSPSQMHPISPHTLRSRNNINKQKNIRCPCESYAPPTEHPNLRCMGIIRRFTCGESPTGLPRGKERGWRSVNKVPSAGRQDAS